MPPPARRVLNSVSTLIPQPTDDQGVPLPRAPLQTTDATMATLAAGGDSGWKVMDLGIYWYQYKRVTIAFFSNVGTLADFRAHCSDDTGGATNPRPVDILSQAFTPQNLTTEVANFPSFSITPTGRYLRYKLINGATAQTALRVCLTALCSH